MHFLELSGAWEVIWREQFGFHLEMLLYELGRGAYMHRIYCFLNCPLSLLTFFSFSTRVASSI